MTRLLLTKIPFFREVILMSFFCEHCNFKNTEVQPAGEIQEQGSKYTFKVTHIDDMERQVVKSDTAILRIEDVDLEVPPGRGRLTNIEGIVAEVLGDLEAGQKTRKVEDLELFEKIDKIVQSLVSMSYGARLPFTISLDDPAGNSSIEPSPSDLAIKDNYIQKHYPRTPEQNATLGLDAGSEERSGTGHAEMVPQLQSDDGGGMEDVDILEGHPYDIGTACPGCTKPAHLVLQMVNIPHFKQLILSNVKCDHCNYRMSDVKAGGAVPEKGKRISLHVKGINDLNRDILKSETCTLEIPEFEIHVQPGTMGSRFSTVEGLLTQIRDDLKSSIFDTGDEQAATDSMPEPKRDAWKTFFSNMDKAIAGEVKYTVLMEDPLANSYCQTFGEPGEDPNVKTEDYERTEAEEESLGLADMKTHLNAEGEYVREPASHDDAGAQEKSTHVDAFAGVREAKYESDESDL